MLDNLLSQLEKSSRINNKPLSVVLDNNLSKYVSASIREQRVNEERGLHFALCPEFLDWHTPYIKAPYEASKNQAKPKETNVEEIYPGRIEAMSNLVQEFRSKQKKLSEKADDLRACIVSNLRKQNQFIYIPETDNFSHNVTITNRRYISVVSSVLANLDFLTKTVVNHAKDSLLIVTTDHGGDESPFQQERNNHETPYNHSGNWPFLLMSYSSFTKGLVDEKVTVMSDQIEGLISLYTNHLDISLHQDVNLRFFKDDLQKLKYLRRFELKSRLYIEQFGDLSKKEGNNEEGYVFAKSPFDGMSDEQEFMEIYHVVKSPSSEPWYVDQKRNYFDYYFRKIRYIQAYVAMLESEKYSSMLRFPFMVVGLLSLFYLFVFGFFVSKSYKKYDSDKKYNLVDNSDDLIRDANKINKKSSNRDNPERNSLFNSVGDKEENLKFVIIKQIFEHKTVFVAIVCYILIIVYSFFSDANDFNLLCYYILLTICLLASDTFKILFEVLSCYIINSFKQAKTKQVLETNAMQFLRARLLNKKGVLLLMLISFLYLSPLVYKFSICFEMFFYNYKNLYIQTLTYLLFLRVYYKLFISTYVTYKHESSKQNEQKLRRLFISLITFSFHLTLISCFLFDIFALQIFSFYNNSTTNTIRYCFFISIISFLALRIIYKISVILKLLDKKYYFFIKINSSLLIIRSHEQSLLLSLDLLAALSVSYFIVTIYDRFLFIFFTEIFFNLFDLQKLKYKDEHSIKRKNAIFPWFNGNVVWLSMWLFIGAEFLYKSNGYYYDWRNRIRLWQKFDLTGLYKAMYHIYSLVLGTVTLKLFFLANSRSKSGKFNGSLSRYDVQINVFFFGVSLICFFKYICGLFTYMDEMRMFRGKVLENVVITHSFLLYLIL